MIDGDVLHGIELEAAQPFQPLAVAAVFRPAVPQVKEIAVEKRDVRANRIVERLGPGG
jgi:hypothetical protein